MAKMSPSTELVQAYAMLKAGQRQAAGHLLKGYLNDHPRDADGWWLMAHTMSKPENVRKCLERVVTLDPNHAKACEKLARLDPIPEDEPDDAFFGGVAPVRSQTPAAPPPPKPKAAAAPPRDPLRREQPPSFEAFAASAPAADNPFAAAHTKPFAGVDGDPVSPLSATAAQAPGTGAQPEWGPGLAFVKDGVGVGGAVDMRPKPPRPRRKGETRPAARNASAPAQKRRYRDGDRRGGDRGRAGRAGRVGRVPRQEAGLAGRRETVYDPDGSLLVLD